MGGVLASLGGRQMEVLGMEEQTSLVSAERGQVEALYTDRYGSGHRIIRGQVSIRTAGRPTSYHLPSATHRAYHLPPSFADLPPPCFLRGHFSSLPLLLLPAISAGCVRTFAHFLHTTPLNAFAALSRVRLPPATRAGTFAPHTPPAPPHHRARHHSSCSSLPAFAFLPPRCVTRISSLDRSSSARNADDTPRLLLPRRACHRCDLATYRPVTADVTDKTQHKDAVSSIKRRLNRVCSDCRRVGSLTRTVAPGAVIPWHFDDNRLSHLPSAHPSS